MYEWELFCNEVDILRADLKSLKEIAAGNRYRYGVYPGSINKLDGKCFFIARDSVKKNFFIFGDGATANKFKGVDVTVSAGKVRICELSNENCSVLRKLFPFTRPSGHKGRPITIGLGDRLGIASAGHIRLVKNFEVFPVLAQQSIRELNLTGRTYEDVLSAASWAVFQEGFTTGFGADGDHLKTADEVKYALNSGFTMITLDCSEYIDNKVSALPQPDVDALYRSKIPEDVKKTLESKYVGKDFVLKDGTIIRFSFDDFKRIVLVYLDAVNFAADIFYNLIKPCGKSIDFEISIDETLTLTSPESHYFAASELTGRGVEAVSVAPRFYGEFQKGIDYIGDKRLFEKELRIHVGIADNFGYKISVHSGSDKFSVFPIIGRLTCGRYHLKTAGTNWLEAVRVIAAKNPSLYRKMHKYAVANLTEAKRYYHISADVARVPDIDGIPDADLPGLMDMADSRQVLHITYGLILTAANNNGIPLFKHEIYSTLNQSEEEYYKSLEKHIGKHLEALGVG